ncbi:matrixin family metalloprotease [Paenibacillus montanisoli]|uniref:Peptidase M10 metallopeptidase domain-containing protein n=1 Tax=Paenibacillus montanisoli TaxID=2081970 RepID=A0A328U8T8_9BACL|nr:matrixin family metalloprotease [Paenibacillus montanisoli]RAP78502.1 hypothetical protein DL346_08805 [Paenibacillus montanisoli]
MRKTVSLTIMLAISFSIIPSAFAANYWYSSKYRFSGGIGDGIFTNNAVYSSSLPDGTVYNMAQTADGAMNQWNNDTEAYFAPTNSSASAFIWAEGYSMGDIGLNGWTEFLKTTTSSPTNLPTDNYQKAVVYGNSYDMWDGTPMTYNQRRAVYTHEIGHALGLAHQNTSGIASIMRDGVGFITNNWLVPQPDDINGVNNLY